MAHMSWHDDLPQAVVVSTPETSVGTTWQHGLPTLCGPQIVLRELRASDALSLCALLSTEEVARFISPPPQTIEGFVQFIAWTLRQRTAGTCACFAVTIDATDTAIGIFHLRRLESGFRTAECGFAIGSAYWGTGVFEEGAELLVRFAFDTVGVHRLEARAALPNGRGNGAVGKVGAAEEELLRKSFLRNGDYLDQALWTVLSQDWSVNPAWSGKEGMIIH